MSDVNSDGHMEGGELVDIETDSKEWNSGLAGLWHTEDDNEEQKNYESGWTIGWRQPKLRHITLRSCKEAVDLEYKVRKLLAKQLSRTDTSQGTTGKKPRIVWLLHLTH
jgi:hypothetical protein